MHPLAGLLIRALVVVAVYVACLWASGFLRPTERAAVYELVTRARSVKRANAERNAR
jgi:hypothetical protein